MSDRQRPGVRALTFCESTVFSQRNPAACPVDLPGWCGIGNRRPAEPGETRRKTDQSKAKSWCRHPGTNKVKTLFTLFRPRPRVNRNGSLKGDVCWPTMAALKPRGCRGIGVRTGSAVAEHGYRVSFGLPPKHVLRRVAGRDCQNRARSLQLILARHCPSRTADGVNPGGDQRQTRPDRMTRLGGRFGNGLCQPQPGHVEVTGRAMGWQPMRGGQRDRR